MHQVVVPWSLEEFNWRSFSHETRYRKSSNELRSTVFSIILRTGHCVGYEMIKCVIIFLFGIKHHPVDIELGSFQCYTF